MLYQLKLHYDSFVHRNYVLENATDINKKTILYPL